MLEEDIKNLIKKVRDGIYPSGVKALAMAAEHTEGNFRRQIASYLNLYLTQHTIDPLQLVVIARALQASALLTPAGLHAILNLKDAMLKTALALAVRSHTIPTIQALIDLGADVELRVGLYSKKPLALAVTYKRVDVVQCLLKVGANVTDEVFCLARTPRAIYHAGIAGILLEHFSQVFQAHLLLIGQGKATVQQINAWLALCNNLTLMSVSKLALPIWQAINEKLVLQANLEALLLHAIQAEYIGAAQYLINIIKRGYTRAFYATDIHGKTALHLAAEKRWHSAIEDLILAGAPLTVEDNAGHTALYIVAELELPGVMTLLAEHMLIQRQAAVLRDASQLNMDDAHIAIRVKQEEVTCISQFKDAMRKYSDLDFRKALLVYVFKATQMLNKDVIDRALGRQKKPVAASSTDAPDSLSASDSGVALSRPGTSTPSLTTSSFLCSARASVPSPSLPDSLTALTSGRK